MEIPAEALAQLKIFVSILKTSPQLWHKPELCFFKEFVESFGGKIPPKGPTKVPPTKSDSQKTTDQVPCSGEPAPEPNEEVESEESDIELDMTGVVEPDTVEPLKPVESKDVSEEDISKADSKKIEAITSYQEGDFERSFALYSEAIEFNPNSALLYAKRAQCSLKRNKPNAAIQDCSSALQINPDCAPAYKFRGRAHRLLGNWLEAISDLRDACKIDFDEEADEWLREVTPNARKLEEHRRKYQRKTEEKDMAERLERVRHAREMQRQAAKEAETEERSKPKGDDFSDMFSLMNDPEISKAFGDPEVVAAFAEITNNPASIMKYQNNPKIVGIIEKVRAKYSKLGSFGGAEAAFNPFSTQPPPPSSGPNPCADDVGLD